jgi:hypothetical protein
MDFVKYKNLIESRGIKLFDHEYRISHFEINNLTNNHEQTGGGRTNPTYKKLKKLDDNHFLNIVMLSLSSNSNLILNLL